jgi:hypothetical protein
MDLICHTEAVLSKELIVRGTIWARSLSGIAVSGERFDLVRELSDSLSSGFFRLSWQVV